ncbi:aromatic ring-hydroxylating oxygenase subunit alpha [Rubritalea tangerina]|uniref:aromatic ring-hydroxylating oxygenase subunit alpha n=1 Tax=Rubritalea tangerina TaxID=430798 RepID=UPI0036213D19
MSTNMLHHLPVEAYTSQEWFDHEQAEIFSKTWRYAGFVEDLTAPGEYLTVQAGLNNIFIIVSADGSLKAFHNSCRHRGTQLLRAEGITDKLITCPYHDWTYNLNGELCTVPDEAREFDTIDKSCLHLKPASVGVWRKMLFVHPDPEAPSLNDWFADITPHLGPHDFTTLVEYPEAATSYEIQANWKSSSKTILMSITSPTSIPEPFRCMTTQKLNTNSSAHTSALWNL